jgi:signal recognition particle subunit SRP19
MANARIEEVEDDIGDPEEMDLDAFDFAQPQGNLTPAMDPSQAQMTPDMMQQVMAQMAGGQPGGSGPGRPPQQMSEKERMTMMREQQEKTKHFQCIYPVYFDATRSRQEGRRVGKEDAVRNPLAREIADALAHIGNSRGIPLQIVLDPQKTHPKDWANPGRVRVLVKQDGRPVSAKIQNKHYLYKLIAEHLKAHPATEETPLKFRMVGLPVPKDGMVPKPAVPRGFKIGEILPLHSPALSGGGVSDNYLKDIMSEMGGQLPPGMEGMAGALGGMGLGGGPSAGGSGGGSQKKVKDKKKK